MSVMHLLDPDVQINNYIKKTYLLYFIAFFSVLGPVHCMPFISFIPIRFIIRVGCYVYEVSNRLSICETTPIFITGFFCQILSCPLYLGLLCYVQQQKLRRLCLYVAILKLLMVTKGHKYTFLCIPWKLHWFYWNSVWETPTLSCWKFLIFSLIGQ
jgi:hypothetical protein